MLNGIFCVFILTFVFLRGEELKNILKVSIFSLMLEHDDAQKLREMLANNRISYTTVDLEGDVYKMNNCFYYLEPSPSGKDKLHIATNHNKYRDVKSLQKKDALISVLKRTASDANNIKFATIKVLWPQWQEKPDCILARYLCGKNRKLLTA